MADCEGQQMADYEEQKMADYYEEDYEEQQMADYYEELADYKNQQMQLQLDLKELKYLQSIAMRSRVYFLLSSEIDNVNSKLAAQSPIPMEKAPSASTNTLKYNRVDSFISADQDNEKIRIYLFLEGVDSEKIDSVIKPNSIDIKMHDVQGKNYRLSIPKLNKKIVPQKSKIVVMPTKVVISLAKSLKWNWSYLHFEEGKPKPKLDEAGTIKLFKKIYEEGNEQTKRMIAKAWTNSRSGRTVDSLKGSI